MTTTLSKLAVLAVVLAIWSSNALGQEWVAVSPMPTGRMGPAVVAGSDGTIYVIGGSTTDNVATSTAANEAYSTVLDTWVRLAPMPTPRRFATAAVDLSGRIYVIGGGRPGFGPTNIVERYLPDQNSWETLPPMATNRNHAAVATGLDGRIFVLGGFNFVAGQLTDATAFDPVSNTWSTLAPLPVATGEAGGATGADGTVYVIGGANFTEEALQYVQAYDPRTNSWSFRADMPTPRGLAGTTGVNGTVYSIGGRIFPSDNALNVVESYSLKHDAWAPAPSLLVKRADLGAATGGDGTVCAFGGYGELGVILNSVECLTPISCFR